MLGIVWNANILMWCSLIACISVDNLDSISYSRELCKVWCIWCTLHATLALPCDMKLIGILGKQVLWAIELVCVGVPLLTHSLRYVDVIWFVRYT